VLNGFAPDDGGGDRLRFRVVLKWACFWFRLRLELRRGLGLGDIRGREVPSSPDSKTSSSSILWVGGEGGRSFLAVGVWNGVSVGEMYLPEVDGPGPATAFPASDNSSMGVIGGGGVNGGGGVISGLLNRGDGRFPVARAERFGRRDRCDERRPGDEEFEETT